MRTFFLSSLFFLVAGCGGDLATPDHCNPLGGARCMTPWPSSIYEVDDPSTETGRRTEYAPGALPTSIDNIPLDPALFAKDDGFSSAAPMMTAFETGIDDSNLVQFTNIAASLTPESPTVLIDMSTGELVAHFAELDVRAADTPASQALFIRSVKMLKGSTRYAVAIKKTLKAPGGRELPIPEGFQAILDGETTTHPLLEKVRGRYTDIFAALSAQGIAKSDVVTAWDFTTRSRTQVQADLLNGRTQVLAMAGANGANFTYTATDTAIADTRFARRVDGTFKAPLFLTNNGSSAPSTTLQRDGDDKPMATGLYDVPFTAIIPQCALDGRAPVGIMIYGHGLLGKAIDQVSSSGTRHAAAEICLVAIGTDMRGMSEQDVPNVVLALNDGNTNYRIFDVLVQGMMNHIALVQAARGPMATQLFVNPAGGASIVDPTKIYYYGISQGGIMGTTVCAIDPVIQRCVVQVGAINYSLLLERSRDWPQYRITLNGAYPNNFDTAMMIALFQQEWDRTEPTGVADTITNGGFPGTPAKQVFMQIAIADDEVSNLGSDYQARTMGIPVITPSPQMPYGIQTTAGPVGSGMVIYDFGKGPIPLTNEAPPDNDVHGSIRNKKATTDMMKRFYETGEIVNACTAPRGCDCTVANGCGAAL